MEDAVVVLIGVMMGTEWLHIFLFFSDGENDDVGKDYCITFHFLYGR